MRDIGKNIREIRQRKNLTQDQLAQRLFVTRQTISNYETGRSRPDIETLLALALVLGLLNLPWAAAAALDGLGLTAGAAGWFSGIPLYGAAVRLAARFPALHRGLCLATAAAWELLRPCKEKNAQ